MRTRITRTPFAVVTRYSWRASPSLTLALAGIVVGGSAASLGGIVMLGAFVGAIPGAIRSGAGSAEAERVLWLLAPLGAVRLAGVAVGSLQGALAGVLVYRAAMANGERILTAGMGPPGVAHLEDPAYADDVAMASDRSSGFTPWSSVQGLVSVASARLSGAGSALILLGFAWWAPLVLLASGVVLYRWLYREVESTWSSIAASTQDVRRVRYTSNLALDAAAAKEIRVFGLADWLVGTLVAQWRTAMTPVWRARGRLRSQMAGATGFAVLAYGAVMASLAHAAITGRIGVGALATFVQAALAVSWYTGDSDYYVRRGALVHERLAAVESRSAEAAASLTGSLPAPQDSPREAICFEDVRFAYPGSDRPVLDGLSLRVSAGTSLALVGENGAGKTTLVKLLARLYDPQAGRVTVDGVDLRDLDPASWRERVSVIFQDFLRYHLPARDNVGFGLLRLRGDDQALDRAAERAGIAELVASLPAGWDTPLSRAYRGGVDLSGGQWQRVALARALLSAGRGGVLILDEPTANLDVRAEAELFDRFLDLTHDTTTVLISHRFSTVRRADRICVIEAGRVVEDGTHAELLALGGRYARMFGLQASRFLDDA